MVGGNPPNHLRDFFKKKKIKDLFFMGQCGPCVWYVENRVYRKWERKKDS
jgi:hypothetical protein